MTHDDTDTGASGARTPLVRWPDAAGDFADTGRCPSCFTPIRPTPAGTAPRVCSRCDLDLADGRLADVLRLGEEILDLERRRRATLAQVRIAQAARRSPAASGSAPVGTAPVAEGPTAEGLVTGGPVTAGIAAEEPVAAGIAPAPSSPAPAVSIPGTPAPGLAPGGPAPAPAAPARAPRRRLTVPVLLLIVGVCLVGIAAIFFLTVAWFVATLAVRALIVGGITLATVLTASLLRRRRLTATAEAIAVIGVLLLALDAWGARANGLLGADGTDPVVYAGAATLAVGALARGWARLARLRAPDLASVLALPMGVALVAAGVSGASAGTATVIGVAAAAIGALAFALPAPWSAARAEATAERTTLAAIGVSALAVAAAGSFFVAFDGVGFILGFLAALTALSALWWRVLGHRAAMVADGWAPLLATAVATTGVLAATTAGWQVALRADGPWAWSVAAPVVAGAVAVAADRVRVRLGVPPVAVAASGIAAAASATLVAAGWVVSGAAAISFSWDPWSTPAALPLTAGGSAALGGAVLLTALLWLAPTPAATRVRDARPLVSALLLLSAALSTAVPAIVAAVGIAVAAASVTLVRGERPRGARGVLAASVPGALGAVAAYAAGGANPGLWSVAVASAVALPVALGLARGDAWRSVPGARPGLAVAAVGVAGISALIAPQAVAAVLGDDRGSILAGTALLLWVGLVALLVALAGGGSRRLPADVADAVTTCGLVAVSAGVGALLAGTAGLASDLLAPGPVSAAVGEPWAGIARGTATVVALGLLVRAGQVPARASIRVPAWAAALLVPTAATVVAAVCRTLGADDATPPFLLATAATLCLAGGLAALRRPWTARAALDAGGLVVVLIAMAAAGVGLSATGLLLTGAVFAAMSVTRGWAAPRARALLGVATTRADGMPLGSAPRRLLVWLAFWFGASALWAALSEGSVTGTGRMPALEAYTAPPALGLVVLTLVLTWLRRHAEAALAVALAVLAGLAVPAVWPGSSTRTLVVTLVAAALCAALPWTAARRLPAVSAVAAASTLIAATAGALPMSQWAGVGHAAWAGVPAVAAFLAAAGFTRPAPGAAEHPGRDPRRWFATTAPPVAVVLGGCAVAVPLLVHGHPVVASVAIGATLALSLAAAARGSVPFGGAVRWASFGTAVLVAAAVLQRVPAVELLSLPIGLTLLGGAALALRRLARTDAAWPGAEAPAWLAGIALAAGPSLLAPAVPGRFWLVVAATLLAATGLAAVASARGRGLAAASITVLLSATVVAGFRAAVEVSGWQGVAISLVAGAGIAAVAAVLVWRRLPPPRLATGAATVGLALTAVVVALRSDGSPGQSAVIAGLAFAGAASAATMLGRPVWRGVAGVVAVGGVVTALVAVGARVLRIAGVPGFEPDAWVLTSALLATGVGVIAIRAARRAPASEGASRLALPTLVGGILAAVVVLVGLALSGLLLVGGSGDGPLRAALAVAALTAAAVAGAVQRPLLGPALPIAAAIAGAVTGILAVVLGAARPIEAVTAAPAIGLLVLGIRRLRRDPAARTWSTLGPGLALLTVPSLAHDLGANDLWRIVGLGIVATALVVLGAVRRLQAPLVVGATVLVAHAVAQLWPWIALSYTATPWWLWVGLGGVLLIVIAARYERQLTALRKAYANVTALR